MMRLTKTVDGLRAILGEERRAGKTIAFVPTMGWLHEGHLSLVDIAREHASFVVVSIFVNPLQFGPTEDYKKYPRDLERDASFASERGVDLIFAPGVEEVYHEENLTFVEVTKLTEGLCGRRRPGHFRGVTTIVAKLLNMVAPDVVVFGQKDAQQAVVVQKMVRDLDFPCRVIIGPTVREEDGLAMSSRNRYLSRDERADAALLCRALREAERYIREGERDAVRIKGRVEEILRQSPLVRIDYIAVTDASHLMEVERVSGRILIALAAFVGSTRLIDNVMMEV
jgi:pantoate--beta-alanine ligase